MQPVLESGGHAEVAAATADGPEQVGLVIGVDVEDPAIGGDDLSGEKVVDVEAVLADEVPDAAPERDAADADGAG